MVDSAYCYSRVRDPDDVSGRKLHELIIFVDERPVLVDPECAAKHALPVVISPQHLLCRASHVELGEHVRVDAASADHHLLEPRELPTRIRLVQRVVFIAQRFSKCAICERLQTIVLTAESHQRRHRGGLDGPVRTRAPQLVERVDRCQ